MFKRKKQFVEPIKEKKKNIFTISSEEAKGRLASIVNEVNIILQNEKFIEATKKVNIPEKATIKDYERIVKETGTNKIYNLLCVLFVDNYDELRKILSNIFIEDFEDYKNKSIKEMCEDISELNANEIGEIIHFFIR